jgi:signal transduction histidine kinase
VPEEVRPDLVAGVREALSNVVKHAQAGAVEVTVTASGERLAVTVSDDGVGTDPAAARGGLVNLRDRAARHGGSFELLPNTPTGTTLTWTVPLV